MVSTAFYSTVYPSVKELAAMTPTQRMETRASSLYEQGYTCSVILDGVLLITSPGNASYETDLDRNTCTCSSYKSNLRKGNPTCKHLLGGRELALRISQRMAKQASDILLTRIPWTAWADGNAVEVRGHFLTWFELPYPMPGAHLRARVELHNDWCEYIRLSKEADEMAVIAWPGTGRSH